MLKADNFHIWFEQSTDGMLVLVDGVFTDCNPAAVAMLGCAGRSQVIGRRPADFSPERQPNGALSTEQVRAHIAEAMAQGNHRFEWVHRRIDGETFPVEVLLTADPPRLYVNWRRIGARKAVEAALQRRLAFEALIIKTSTEFINLKTEQIDQGISQALAEIGAFVEADRSYVFMYTEDGERMNNLYEWCAEGIEPQIAHLQEMPIHALVWSNERLLRREILNIPRVADLPPEAEAEREEFARQDNKSMIVVPMENQGLVVGFVGFDSVRQERQWPDEIVDLLRILAGTIANVLDRRRAELALRRANAALEERVAERTRQLDQRRRVAESLREILAFINSARPLSAILDRIVQEAKELTGAGACVLYDIDREAGTASIAAASPLSHSVSKGFSFSLDSVSGRELEYILAQPSVTCTNFDPKAVERTQNDPALDEDLRRRRADILKRYAASLSVPLRIQGEPYGALLFYYGAPQTFTEQQIGLASTFAEQSMLAIENARLYRAEAERRYEAERRRRIAEGLRESLAVLNSNRPLDDILSFIVSQAIELLETSAGALYLLDGGEQMLSIGAAQGLDPSYTALKIPVGGAITGRAIERGRPISVPDIEAADTMLSEYLTHPDMPAGWLDALDWLRAQYNAVLAVPVMTRGTRYGALTLYYQEAQRFSDETIALGAAFGNQAALVIESMRLREQIEETAATAERQRLARELHDAVTQTLFSANMIAGVLPDLWEIDREDARQRLDQLGQLTRGALAEMRALLLELRPSGLVETKMSALLQQLVDGAGGRSTLDIALNVQGRCELAPDVKVVFYRIAQEALNNIIKHAGATQAFISLRCLDDDKVVLQILDDGHGFHPGAVEEGHFGLRIMEERAASIHATFVIDTQPEQGTEITVFWTAC